VSRSLKPWAIIGVAFSASLVLSAQDPVERVLIRASKPYSALVAAIESRGGRVTNQFTYVDGLSAELPVSALSAVRSLAGAAAVGKDIEIPVPISLDPERWQRNPAPLHTAGDEPFETASALDDPAIVELASVHPDAFLINLGLANVSAQHAAGYTGLGVVVAQIDAGIRPGFPHISSDGSVIGCEDFVHDALGCVNSGNDGHGTFVAGMISANVAFTFPAASPVRAAILAECPLCFANPPTNTIVPMMGTAPRSSIFMLRVFGPTGGAPASRIIAAIDRAIQLRELANAGQPGGVKIQVVNMSLGGPTTIPGSDLEDLAVDALLQHDIVPVIAGGNAGPSSLTVGSPASSRSAIAVGAANLSHNERIYSRLVYGPADGAAFRPSLGHQIAYFSSRGPNADGRNDPDVVANGFACFGQGYGSTSSLFFGFGTSYSTGTVSGVAAVLRQRFPAATARQIRNAIAASGNPAILGDAYTKLDQGSGYVDAGAAAALLAAGNVPDTVPTAGNPNSSVKVNVEQNTDLVVQDGLVQEALTGLRPGERRDILYRVHPNTTQVVVALGGVTPFLPPAQQNQLFGDDIILGIHSAKTSSIGEGDYKVLELTKGATHAIANPEPGIMRVTVSGDWTNAGTIAATVSIFSLTDPIPGFSAQGKLLDDQTLVFPLAMPAGVSVADFRLSWREDWGEFPTNDLDLILVRPNGTALINGATLNNPEVVSVRNPPAGQWLVVVDGFMVNTNQDKFELRVALDGKVVKK
jgi:hypothetical protein